MISYEIKIDISRLLHYSEFLKSHISNETLLMLIKSFSEYVRDLYLLMIEEEIFSNRYKGRWEPIEDKEYLKYIGTIPTNHIMSIIEDAIEIRKIKQSIIVRIDPEYLYPGSKIRLLMVLRAIDNGTSKFNARPLFKSIVRQLNSSLPSLWKNYLRKKGVT